MSVRFDASTDRITYAGAVPALSSGITVLGWAYVVAANFGGGAANQTMCRLHASDGGSTVATFATNGAPPSPPAYFTTGGSLVSSTGSPVGEWRRVAWSCTGSTGTLVVATPTGTPEVDTGTVATGTPTGITLGGRAHNVTDEWFNGRLAYWRVWTTVLSDSERLAEWASPTPVRTANLWADWPLVVHTDLTDHSGNGRHLVASSTAVTTEAGPTLGGAVAAAGTSPVAATATAVANVARPATGTAVGSSSAGGSGSAARAAAGVASSAGSATAGTSVSRPSTGTASSAAAASGAAGVFRPATASAATAAGAAGQVSVARQVSGSAAASSAATGVATVVSVSGVAGTANAAAAAVGTAGVARSAQGTASSASTAVGSASVSRPLRATAAAASSAGGTALVYSVVVWPPPVDPPVNDLVVSVGLPQAVNTVGLADVLASPFVHIVS